MTPSALVALPVAKMVPPATTHPATLSTIDQSTSPPFAAASNASVLFLMRLSTLSLAPSHMLCSAARWPPRTIVIACWPLIALLSWARKSDLNAVIMPPAISSVASMIRLMLPAMSPPPVTLPPSTTAPTESLRLA